MNIYQEERAWGSASSEEIWSMLMFKYRNDELSTALQFNNEHVNDDEQQTVIFEKKRSIPPILVSLLQVQETLTCTEQIFYDGNSTIGIKVHISLNDFNIQVNSSFNRHKENKWYSRYETSLSGFNSFCIPIVETLILTRITMEREKDQELLLKYF